METRSFKRRKTLKALKDAVDGRDREDGISNLPDDILHQILSLLPIKSIAQSSLLSKRWRHLWKSIPDLDFTTVTPLATTTLSGRDTNKKRRLLARPPTSKDTDFLSKVLTLRDKTNSDVRVLRVSAHLSFTHLNRLIRVALKRNVQELDIEVATNDYFNLPRSVIRSGSLRVLKFKSCFPGFRLPPSSVVNTGFRLLHTLSLSLLILYDQPKLVDMFTDTSFPLLRRLSLDACFGLRCLKIGCQGLLELILENCFQLIELEVHGEKLNRVRIVGCFDAYSNESRFKIVGPSVRVMDWEYNALINKYEMEDLRSLEEASVEFIVLVDEISVEKLLGVGKLMSGLSQANTLTLQTQCVEILSSKHELMGIGVPVHDPFTSLKSLEVHTGRFNGGNMIALAQLLKNSPSLHTLIVNITLSYKTDAREWNRELWEMYATEGTRFWDSQTESLKPILESLRVVKMHGFSECENEIWLAKFLLRHGMALEEMILCSGKRGHHKKDSLRLRRDKIKSQMMSFSWASSNVKISFL